MLYKYFELWATALMVAAIIALGVGWSYSKCHSRAAMQGMECSWGPLQGCMVKMKDGTWMDYDRLRYME